MEKLIKVSLKILLNLFLSIIFTSVAFFIFGSVYVRVDYFVTAYQAGFIQFIYGACYAVGGFVLSFGALFGLVSLYNNVKERYTDKVN